MKWAMKKIGGRPPRLVQVEIAVKGNAFLIALEKENPDVAEKLEDGLPRGTVAGARHGRDEGVAILHLANIGAHIIMPSVIANDVNDDVVQLGFLNDGTPHG